MKYNVNGVVYNNVEEAFNTYIESFNTEMNPVICSIDKGCMKEIIRIFDAKLVYEKLNDVPAWTPLKKQFVGYIMKNARTIKDLVYSLKDDFRNLRVSVDKYEFEDLIFNFYYTNTEKVRVSGVEKSDNHTLNITVNNKLIGKLGYTDYN